MQKKKEIKNNKQREYSKTKEGKLWKKKQNQRRQLCLTATINNITGNQWHNKLKRSLGICKLCKTSVGEENLTLDHRFPVAKAYKRFLRTGKKTTYTIRKVDAICAKCNASKRDR